MVSELGQVQNPCVNVKLPSFSFTPLLNGSMHIKASKGSQVLLAKPHISIRIVKIDEKSEYTGKSFFH